MDSVLVDLNNWLLEWRLIWVYGVSVVIAIGLLYLLRRLRWYRRQIARYHDKLEQSEQARIDAEEIAEGLLNAQQQGHNKLAQLEKQLAGLQLSLKENEKALATETETAKQYQSKIAEQHAKFERLDSEIRQRDELIDHLQVEVQQYSQQSELQSDLKTKIDELQQTVKQQQAELKRQKEKLEQTDKSVMAENLHDGYISSVLDNALPNIQAEVVGLSDDEQLTRLERENEGLKKEAQRGKKLESYFLKHNEQLLLLNKELQSTLTQVEITSSDDALTLAHKATALLKRLLNILSIEVSHEGLEENETAVDISEQAEALWIKHYDYIDQLLERATGLVQASETATNDRVSSSLYELRQVIDGQKNHIARLEYDLEIKKLLIKERGLSEDDIPASIIKRQQEYQARIEELERRLTKIRTFFKGSQRDAQMSFSGILDQMLYKVKSLLS